MLEEQVRLGQNDPEIRALREKLKADARLAANQRRVNGISGAVSSGATADAQAFQLENDSLITRTIGRAVNNTITSAAQSLGLDQNESAAAAVAASRLIASSSTAGIIPMTGNTPQSQTQSLEVLQSIDKRLESIDRSNTNIDQETARAKPVTPSLSSVR
jgi:hypothetical protein